MADNEVIIKIAAAGREIRAQGHETVASDIGVAVKIKDDWVFYPWQQIVWIKGSFHGAPK